MAETKETEPQGNKPDFRLVVAQGEGDEQRLIGISGLWERTSKKSGKQMYSGKARPQKKEGEEYVDLDEITIKRGQIINLFPVEK